MLRKFMSRLRNQMPVYTIVVMLLSGCASSGDPKVSLGSNEYGFHNAGLVVGRIPATTGLSGPRGLRIWLSNDTTKGGFSTASGLFGYTDSEYFAIWLPPDEYSLIAVFAYNGAVRPIDEPFRFVVRPGVMMYVGTLVSSWEIPRGVLDKLGRPLAVKRHGREQCHFFVCKMEPPYADIGLFDEGPSFEQELRKALPDLPNVRLERGLMS